MNGLLRLSFALMFNGVDTVQSDECLKSESIAISMIELIANREKYADQVISVTGVISNKYEDTMIYFSKDHYDLGSSADAIWLPVDKVSKRKLEGLDGRWVNFVGYHGYDGGYRKSSFESICDITILK